jgi:predicted component of type VI protein secretion system
MPKMILSMDGLVLKEIELTKERITIGRRPHNDVVIDNLAVSGEHAVVVTLLKDSFLEDMGSTNGTMVNGQPIKKHFLQNNDIVELGKYKLKYVLDGATPAYGGDFSKTPARDAAAAKLPTAATAATDAKKDSAEPVAKGFPGATAEGVRPSPADAEASKTVSSKAEASVATAVLQILNGSNKGKELVLAKSLTTLGRPGIQVAVIARRPQGYFITHVEGASFPIVNGKTLGPEAQPVNDHDIIELSGTKMEFFFR